MGGVSFTRFRDWPLTLSAGSLKQTARITFCSSTLSLFSPSCAFYLDHPCCLAAAYPSLFQDKAFMHDALRTSTKTEHHSSSIKTAVLSWNWRNSSSPSILWPIQQVRVKKSPSPIQLWTRLGCFHTSRAEKETAASKEHHISPSFTHAFILYVIRSV